MGHPKVTNAAVFDIITPDLTHGPTVASAELISMMNRCLDMFPNLSQTYDIHVSHSKSKPSYDVVKLALILLTSLRSGDEPTFIPRQRQCG